MTHKVVPLRADEHGVQSNPRGQPLDIVHFDFAFDTPNVQTGVVDVISLKAGDLLVFSVISESGSYVFNKVGWDTSGFDPPTAYLTWTENGRDWASGLGGFNLNFADTDFSPSSILIAPAGGGNYFGPLRVGSDTKLQLWVGTGSSSSSPGSGVGNSTLVFGIIRGLFT